MRIGIGLLMLGGLICGPIAWSQDTIDEVRPISERILALKKQASDASTPIQKREVAISAVDLGEDVIASENYDDAKELASMAVVLIKPSMDSANIQRVREFSQKCAALSKQWKLVTAARETLENNPDDPKANETAGRYLCLIRKDWNTGLAHLAKCSNGSFRSAAEADLKNFEEPGFQQSVADLWREAARANKKDKVAILSRAAHWYEKAIKNMKGETKVEAESTLEKVYDEMTGREFKKTLKIPANGVQSQGTVDCPTKGVRTSMSPGFNFSRSWLLSMQFNTREIRSDSEVLFAWADGRNGRDPILIRLHGRELRCDVDDCKGDQRQSLMVIVPHHEQDEWVDVKFLHDAKNRNLELYIDYQPIRTDALTISPNADREMPVCLCGIENSPPPFSGKIRAVWLGNIK